MPVIVEDDLSDSSARALVELHLRGMHAHSPPGAVFALDLAGLKAPGIAFWTARANGEAVGMAALKDLGDAGELKSMRTRPEWLRRGIAAALLEQVISEARRRGMKRLSLETGSGPAFEPALALYRRRGFVEGGAFGDYEKTDFNLFLHLDLKEP